MSKNEMFDSTTRSAGDLAGVFEFDEDVGYFYLYDLTRDKDKKVIGAIRILSGAPDFDVRDIEIYWNSIESKVGLFIRKQLWAVFDADSGASYGGNYRSGIQAEIPFEILETFET